MEIIFSELFSRTFIRTFMQTCKPMNRKSNISITFFLFTTTPVFVCVCMCTCTCACVCARMCAHAPELWGPTGLTYICVTQWPPFRASLSDMTPPSFFVSQVYTVFHNQDQLRPHFSASDRQSTFYPRYKNDFPYFLPSPSFTCSPPIVTRMRGLPRDYPYHKSDIWKQKRKEFVTELTKTLLDTKSRHYSQKYTHKREKHRHTCNKKKQKFSEASPVPLPFNHNMNAYISEIYDTEWWAHEQKIASNALVSNVRLAIIDQARIPTVPVPKERLACATHNTGLVPHLLRRPNYTASPIHDYNIRPTIHALPALREPYAPQLYSTSYARQNFSCTPLLLKQLESLEILSTQSASPSQPSTAVLFH